MTARRTSTLLHAIALCVFVAGCAGRILYTQDDYMSEDNPDCGLSEMSPCRTIRYCLENRTQNNDVIRLLPNPNNAPYEECSENTIRISGNRGSWAPCGRRL
ncbi:uncharacterized protein LOC144442543 [Glandiceps talaboti]